MYDMHRVHQLMVCCQVVHTALQMTPTRLSGVIRHHDLSTVLELRVLLDASRDTTNRHCDRL
jgi:hypothetical protein